MFYVAILGTRISSSVDESIIKSHSWLVSVSNVWCETFAYNLRSNQEQTSRFLDFLLFTHFYNYFTSTRMINRYIHNRYLHTIMVEHFT